jgi:hypothetical protein
LIKNEAVNLSQDIDKAIDIISNPTNSENSTIISTLSNQKVKLSNSSTSNIYDNNLKLADNCPDATNPSCSDYVDPNSSA